MRTLTTHDAHTECRLWGADRGWECDEHGVCTEFCGNSECIRYGPVYQWERVPRTEVDELMARGDE